MIDAIAEAKCRLTSAFEKCERRCYEPIRAEPWVVSSLLQKAIRRGEKDIAQRAAQTLFALKGSAVWRRYMIIAFEDIGVGSPDAVIATVAAGSDAEWRKQLGGSAYVAVALAGFLADAAKE